LVLKEKRKTNKINHYVVKILFWPSLKSSAKNNNFTILQLNNSTHLVVIYSILKNKTENYKIEKRLGISLSFLKDGRLFLNCLFLYISVKIKFVKAFSILYLYI
jgi:hypothetical protein